MSKADIISAVAQILSGNIGNKLTVELAHGMIVVLGQNVPDDPKDEPAAEAVAE